MYVETAQLFTRINVSSILGSKATVNGRIDYNQSQNLGLWSSCGLFIRIRQHTETVPVVRKFLACQCVNAEDIVAKTSHGTSY